MTIHNKTFMWERPVAELYHEDVKDETGSLTIVERIPVPTTRITLILDGTFTTMNPQLQAVCSAMADLADRFQELQSVETYDDFKQDPTPYCVHEFTPKKSGDAK